MFRIANRILFSLDFFEVETKAETSIESEFLDFFKATTC